ncbi:MAG: hypothetical protein K9J47_03080 [Sulfuritalea sp.]|nr:hypothetical protein [Polynucleobacter sp.]MCF8187737.1 hypothetical protein [Sulfuritalea sp.]
MRSLTHHLAHARRSPVRVERTHLRSSNQTFTQAPQMRSRRFIDAYAEAPPYMRTYVQDWIEKNQQKLDLSSSDVNVPGNSTFALPTGVVSMSANDIESFLVQKSEVHQGVLHGIGKLRLPSDCNPLEVDGFVLEQHTQTTRPGLGRFKEVACGGYDNRPYKYLYVIDADGLHIVREFTECEKSSRGIAVHSLIKSHAIIGGEAFFDANEPSRVYINFGSSRYYPTSVKQMENTAKYWLACGYDEVVAVFSSRDLQNKPYGMKDRYGKNLPNVIYRRAENVMTLNEIQPVDTLSQRTKVTFDGKCYG